jgi:DNA-binding GntR family transcriptional regulator
MIGHSQGWGMRADVKKNQKNSKQPLAVTAYETILRRIICLEYQPSQHLEESQLMADLGIGRTPIREALVRLHGERMVESHPNRGMVVRPITLQNTKAMFESMRIFEFGVVDIAVNKDCTTFIEKMKAANLKIQAAVESKDLLGMVEANHLFHINFARCSQNEFLIRAVHDVRSEAKRLSYLSYNNSIGPGKNLELHYKAVVEEHDRIVACIENHDSKKLKQLLTDHILTFRERIILFMVS